MKDLEILKRIRKGDETALQYLYKQHYRMMLRMVLKNSGTEEEAQDIFQEALILFWQKAQKDDFQLTSKISTFLYSVCNNLWRKELDKKSRVSHESVEKSIENDWGEKQEKVKIIEACLNKLSPTCKQVLQYYYFDELSMQDIAEKMGLAGADTAKTKKYKCKKELDEIIKRYFKSSDFLD